MAFPADFPPPRPTVTHRLQLDLNVEVYNARGDTRPLPTADDVLAALRTYYSGSIGSDKDLFEAGLLNAFASVTIARAALLPALPAKD